MWCGRAIRDALNVTDRAVQHAHTQVLMEPSWFVVLRPE